MNGRRVWLSLLVGANVALALAVWTRQPWANGPAEWRWEYLPAGGLERGALAWLGILAALAGLGLLRGRRRLAAWRGAPLAAAACGAVFTFALVAAQPGGFARVASALVSRNSFGYVWDAALAPSTSALLADYPAASAGLDQHSVTHPPGPLLAVRALGWLDRVLAPPAGDSLPAPAAAAIEREVGRARSHGRPVPQPPPGPWTVAALAVLLPALSALAGWPLYLLARRLGQARETALLAAVLWQLVPARSLFTPSFDQALPALLVGAAWLAAGGGRARAVAAGVLLFAACFASYGCLAALPLVAACAVAASPRAAAGWQRWGALALGFAVPYLALFAAAGHDPWHALRAALALHHRIAVAPRSYATWLLWNPYDFALLLSPGVLGLAAGALLPAAWQGGGKPATDGAAARQTADGAAARQAAAGPGAAVPAAAATGPRSLATSWRGSAALAAWTWWALLALLLLSGGVRGEAGRIWLVWMPFACLVAAAAVAHGDRTRRAERPAEAHAPGSRLSISRLGTWDYAVAVLLATEAALSLALAAGMVFVSAS
ncbi:MAG: hypothetical protein JOZ15_20665 [Acidobacteria bacterium]|nr:hypothetical protein [Acidobacteriota bacterium]